MNISRCGLTARWTGIFLAAAVLALGGCDGDDGATGPAGADGADGINCWDTNENGVADPAEDVNGDGTIDVFDCQTPPPSIAAPSAPSPPAKRSSPLSGRSSKPLTSMSLWHPSTPCSGPLSSSPWS